MLNSWSPCGYIPAFFRDYFLENVQNNMVRAIADAVNVLSRVKHAVEDKLTRADTYHLPTILPKLPHKLF